MFFHRALGAPWSRLLRMSNDPRFLTASVPSGNVIVTARDVAAFYQCLLDGGTLDGTRVFAPAAGTGARPARRRARRACSGRSHGWCRAAFTVTVAPAVTLNGVAPSKPGLSSQNSWV